LFWAEFSHIINLTYLNIVFEHKIMWQKLIPKKWRWYNLFKIWAILVILYAVYFLLGSPSKFVEQFATIAGALAAIFGLGFIALQLYWNAQQTKRQRTFELVSKFYDPHYVKLTHDAGYFLTSDLTDQQKIDAFFNRKNHLNPHIRKKCIVLFSLYEDIAQMYNMKLLDKEVITRALRGAIIYMFNKSEPIIKEFRYRTNNQQIYLEWELCALELKKEDVQN